MLLQIGLPGGPEILLFNVLVAVVVAYFTYRDAEKRPGVNETLWAAIMGLASLLLNLIGFIIVFAIYYFVVVRD
jgi:RsiW-degrading membrane proteinase PrsW (M82 family)